ncbi:MAG: dynamin family protein [Lachnospiraceae bacterium]|nr:dynamin family protein [Lachnospiraceae bacterium]
MLETFGIVDDKIIPICVMATMSSGKSTFINAILGEEILPEKNEACTSRALAVINNQYTQETRAYLHKKDGTKGVVEIFNQGIVSRINADENVESVLIEKNILSLSNLKKQIVLIDTPGVNNSEDIRHAKRTEDILKRIRKGIIIYLLNVTQLATNDDEILLQMVLDNLRKKPDVRIIFVLNKIDMLDEEKESISNVICVAKQYIKSHGVENIKIFPISALSAKTFRMKLYGNCMTKNEEKHLEQNFPEYYCTTKSMLQYADSYNQYREEYKIGDLKVTEYELRRAIENTGIVEIEKQLQEFILQQEIEQINLDSYSILEGYKDLEGVYSRKRKSKNIKNYEGEVKWICKSCKQINGEYDNCINCGESNVRLSLI